MKIIRPSRSYRKRIEALAADDARAELPDMFDGNPSPGERMLVQETRQDLDAVRGAYRMEDAQLREIHRGAPGLSRCRTTLPRQTRPIRVPARLDRPGVRAGRHCAWSWLPVSISMQVFDVSARRLDHCRLRRRRS